MTGADVLKKVGETVEVSCQSGKFFTKDKWDADPEDNLLHVRCKPDGDFDVPLNSDMPQCKSKCPADKPVPEAGDKLALDTKWTEEGEIWEEDSIWSVLLRDEKVRKMKVILEDGSNSYFKMWAFISGS